MRRWRAIHDLTDGVLWVPQLSIAQRTSSVAGVASSVVQEGEELLSSIPPVPLADHLAGGDVQGEKRVVIPWRL